MLVASYMSNCPVSTAANMTGSAFSGPCLGGLQLSTKRTFLANASYSSNANKHNTMCVLLREYRDIICVHAAC